MKQNFKILLAFLIILASCKNKKQESTESTASEKETVKKEYELIKEKPDSMLSPEGMVWVSGINFTMGAQNGDPMALPRERPAHLVAVNGFFIDQTEVTNAFS
ncbi:SUMF1/EgtB/PvdO family nonheme iron enzyme [Christiangramia forsetii]|uniref:Sulfatase-modifying factor enzyme-like domain-containing protein n=2 Tax=Christiangramia forsetii TaxID=411153 RepID=A0M0G0_CHRFK|nr:SUMF1/EgtB/PvdO family nonheme iron enzyme [Christiangramia forsetii]GGG40973.1 hypothetical protein GCM10011532_25890 [Christiangramia forsetii]CAL66105.1 conserved hypothetical protein [Christiangramia forsetii KT0803]